MLKIGSVLCLIFLASLVGYSQSENTLYWLDNVYQSSATNPVSIPKHKISIGLPVLSSVSTYGYLQHHTVENSTYKDGDSLVFDEDKLLKSSLTDNNYIGVGVRIALFHAQVKVHRTWWSLHIQDRLDYRFRYPKEFVMLAAEGNAQFEGQRVDLSNLAVDAVHYREFAAGFVTERDKWNFGGKAKLLFGMANVSSDIARFDYEIKDDSHTGDPGFSQLVYAEGSLRTSGIDTSGNTAFEDYVVNTANVGAAIDVGATFKMNENWTFSASVLDLGFIRWASKDNINYHFQGDTALEGFDPTAQFFEGPEENFSNVFDSLLTSYHYNTDNEAYTTVLNYKLNFAATYSFSASTNLTALLQLNNYYGLRPSLNIGFNHRIKRVFHFVLTNTFEVDDPVNIGLGGDLTLGPVQLYLVTDYLSGLLDAYNTSNFNVRFGVNFVFGKVLSQQALPYNNN